MQVVRRFTCKYRQQLQWLIFIAAAALCVTTVCHHEMWRDESQAWLIARDSKSLAELWNNIRYEGHPALWHFILFIANKIAPSPYTIQVIHVIIGLATLVLVVFNSPFSLLQKFLLSFSYFLSYEYFVISRNYGIGILLLLLSVVIFFRKKENQSLIVPAFLLGLAANTNVYALIISVWLFFFFVVSKYKLFNLSGWKKLPFYAVSLMFAAFVVVAALQLKAPVDRIPAIKYQSLTWKKLEKLISKVSYTFLYLPDSNKNESFWNSHFFKSKNNQNKTTYYTVLLLLLLLLSLVLYNSWRDKKILFFFLATFVSLASFALIVFDTEYIRHQGHFFVLLVITFWLLKERTQLNRISSVAFTLVCVFQFVSGLAAHFSDIKYKFSNGKSAAAFLQQTGRDKQGILLNPDFAGLSILHYANIKQAYYPVAKSYGSFVKFKKGRKWYPLEVMMKDADSLKLQTLIFNAPLQDTMAVKYGYTLIYSSGKPASVKDELFYIYGKQRS